jgi:ankyrin repeat protein
MNEDLGHAVWKQSDIRDLTQLARMLAGGTPPDRPMNDLAYAYPLGVAACDGNVEACRMLLEAGADPYLCQEKGVSVFGLVVNARNPGFELKPGSAKQKFPVERMEAIFDLLVRYGATPNGMKDLRQIGASESPVYRAALKGDHEAIDVLARLGADLNVACNAAGSPFAPEELESPVRAAIKGGHDAALLTLLRHGASPASLETDTLTPFQACVAAGLDRTVDYFVREGGEDLAQRSSTGRSLAQLAKIDSTRQLLKSLKTELAIKHAMDGQAGTANTIGPAKKGMAPL